MTADHRDYARAAQLAEEAFDFLRKPGYDEINRCLEMQARMTSAIYSLASGLEKDMSEMQSQLRLVKARIESVEARLAQR